MTRLKQQYQQDMVPALMQQLSITNRMAVPKMTKLTVNVGLGRGLKDKTYIETVQKTLERITGQRPVFTKARKSIATFKIREGLEIGMKVTLRGPRMYDFVEKLVSVTFPRVRDFQGITERAVDSAGNFNYGFREHIAFPEVPADEVDRLHGLQVTITTNAKTHANGLALFQALGFPFKKK